MLTALWTQLGNWPLWTNLDYMAKVRADRLLVEQGLAETRSKARALIMAGQVLADGRRVDKAGENLPPDTKLTLKGGGGEYVSRGGDKLAGALEDLGVDPTGLCVLDLGASTGGFTDCLLKNGACRVTAVDVGYGLMDWRLRQDSRVTLIERTNARGLTREMAPGPYDLVVMDLSFISLTKVLGPVKALLEPGARILALVKPQFEVGRENVGKGGVVRSPEKQREAVAQVVAAAEEIGFITLGTAASRLTGPKGNQEHFILLELR